MMPIPFACASGFADCDGVAATDYEVDTRASASNCGGCGRECATGQVCTAGTCACPTGQHLFAGGSVADAAPRPLAPLSLGDVTQRRPTQRWELSAGYDGAVVELCRDRACTMVIETLAVTGRSARPVADLPASQVVFWRVRGRAGASVDSMYSPTWLFHVPAVSATWTQPAAGTAAVPDRRLEGAVAGDRLGYSVASAVEVHPAAPRLWCLAPRRCRESTASLRSA